MLPIFMNRHPVGDSEQKEKPINANSRLLSSRNLFLTILLGLDVNLHSPARGFCVSQCYPKP